MKSGIGLLLVNLLFLGFAVAGYAETRIFDLRHRRAAEVADAVRTVLDDEAKVTAVERSLVVNAAPGDIVTAAELIKRLDRPPRMLRVIVGQSHTQAEEGTGIDASGRVAGGDATVILGRPAPPPRGGATVILSDNGDLVSIGAAAGSSREASSVEQFVVTLEGSPARISVGQRIPFTERWLVLASRHARVVESVHYESVDTGFEVEPELFGDQVQLDIRPYLAFRDPRAPREIRFQELTSRVTIPLGQWFDLGGTMASRDEVSREILGASRGSGEGEGTVRVRVELQPD